MEYFNIAYERSILSSFLFEPRQFEECKGLLNYKDFYLPSHQNIFSAMMNLSSEDKPIDEEFIKTELIKKKCFDETVMLDILSSNPISQLDKYIEDIIELANHRLILSLSNELRDEAETEQKIELIKDRIHFIENRDVKLEDIDCGDLLDMHFENKTTYDTGIDAISDIVGGLHKGQLIYITGSEETGKTHISYKIMENLSTFNKVGIISLEFGKRKLKERLEGMIKRGHKVEPKNIKATFDSHDIVKIEKIIKKWAREGVGFLVLDSFNLIENTKAKDANQNIIDTGRRLFKLTQQLDILLLVISTSTKLDHKEGNPSIYGGQLLNHYCDQKWHIMRDLETEERLIWVNKNKQNYQYGKEKLYFSKDGSISKYKAVPYAEYKYEQNDGIEAVKI